MSLLWSETEGSRLVTPIQIIAPYSLVYTGSSLRCTRSLMIGASTRCPSCAHD